MKCKNLLRQIFFVYLAGIFMIQFFVYGGYSAEDIINFAGYINSNARDFCAWGQNCVCIICQQNHGNTEPKGWFRIRTNHRWQKDFLRQSRCANTWLATIVMMLKRILCAIFSVFVLLAPGIGHSAEMVNVEYIHNTLNWRWDIDLPRNPLTNPYAAANMKYLLTVVDIANEYLNDEKTTNYGDGEYHFRPPPRSIVFRNIS